jgi:hypothetical protein
LTLPLGKSKIRHVSNAWKKRIACAILGESIIIFILLLTFDTVITTARVSASPEASTWTRVNIPAEGTAAGWVLAANSDIQHLTASADGTLYAYGKGLTYTLYKSTDGGLKWSYIGKVQDAITDIAVSPHDAATIYYATSSKVFRSTDGGKNFIQMPNIPGGAGAGNITITSLAVTWLNNNVLAVGTRDTDNSEFGGVYILDEAEIYAGWMDASIGNYDVYAVAFSPNYATDRQIIAVVTDEADTIVINKIGNADWNAFIGSARLDRDNSGTPTAVAVAHAAVIAFPNNYDALLGSADRFFFVGINTGAGQGDVYKVKCNDAPGISLATDLNVGGIYGESNIDITSLISYSQQQSVNLLAGSANSSRTYTSTDGGSSWAKCRKEPTGGSDTSVAVAPDYGKTGIMYAATSGNGSALSISRDMGTSWNQISLIDTTIDNIIDLAISPGGQQGNTMFMITFGGKHSLWRSPDDGNTWERVLSGYNADVDTLTLVSLSPRYGVDCQTVFIAGESNGNPAIWESQDNCQTYLCRNTRDPATGAAFSVDALISDSKNTLYIGSYNGTQGKIYQTDNFGFFYSRVVTAGAYPVSSLVLSPDYEKDGTMLAGNTHGWVYWSSDNGSSFQPLPEGATTAPLDGDITVVFDPELATNHTVYAASGIADGGIYRFIIGKSENWESIDSTLPAGATLNRLVVTGDGTLYAVNSDPEGGMERCLDPELTSGTTFDTVTRGLSAGAALSGLWQRDRHLWSIDAANCRLMTYTDTLVAPPAQVSPQNEAPAVGSLTDHAIRNITIDWETVDGATSYDWQCCRDTDFSSIPAGFEDTTSASYARLPTLEPATTYYWRVRVSAPAFSPWSPKWLFTTSMDTEVVTLKAETPAAGAKEVPVKPVFQWTAVIGADAYELLVATDADFTHPVIAKINDYVLKTNAWLCDVSLDYETTYYWKVRAATPVTRSAWSSAGVFTTESPPPLTADEATPTATLTPTPQVFQDSIAAFTPSKNTLTAPAVPSPEQSSPPSPTTPASSPIQIPALSQLPDMPVWIVFLIGGLFSIVILALIIVLTVVLKIKRF